MLSRRATLAGTFLFAASLPVLPARAEAPKPSQVLTPDELAELMRAPQLGDRALGEANAPCTIVEYASMTCPHCAAFHGEVLPKLKAGYIETGKVRFIFREFPLDSLAMGASMLARCAPGDRYFPMIEILYQMQRSWAATNDPVAALLAIARQTGFTQETFETCLKDQALLDALLAEKKRGETRFGIDSTPTLFINGQKYRGALRFEDLEQVIAPLLHS